MVEVHHAKGDSNFIKMRPFRRGRFFDKVSNFDFYMFTFNCSSPHQKMPNHTLLLVSSPLSP